MPGKSRDGSLKHEGYFIDLCFISRCVLIRTRDIHRLMLHLLD